MLLASLLASLLCLRTTAAFSVQPSGRKTSTVVSALAATTNNPSEDLSRRLFLATTATAAFTLASPPADAVGPVKITLKPTSYSAQPCPPSKPIPGQQAMKGMRGLCVTVQADLLEASPKDLEKVGVYGFVTDGVTGDSVLANNPDLSTDAGQFSMIEEVLPSTRKVTFEFVAAVPQEKDLSAFENGIGPLDFASLRLISFPGGQQYGAISPCEMNEFSDECEAWEAENGPYQKTEFMMKKNPRTASK